MKNQEELNKVLFEAETVEEVKAAIEAGADVNAQDRYGWTPLHGAAHSGRMETCQLLIEKGADVNVKNKDLETPLHRAAYWGRTEKCKVLIDAGADVNVKDEDGWTPLHFAACWDRTETCHLLIEKGADVNAKDEDGKTPLDRASNKKIKDIFSKDIDVDDENYTISNDELIYIIENAHLEGQESIRYNFIKKTSLQLAKEYAKKAIKKIEQDNKIK